MPSYMVACAKPLGLSQNSALTRYAYLYSYFKLDATEANMQIIARDSYTLSDLFVRIITNSLNGATTIKSRIDGADGNQVVSIGAGATGAFTDAANSDSLVSGNLFCTEMVTGGDTGSISTTVISYILSTASNTTPILCTPAGKFTRGSQTEYPTIGGWACTAYGSPEAVAAYTFRVSAILSNLRIYVSLNDATSASYIKVRVNGADGNQVVNIGAGATGAFEDAVNTDEISIGDDVNYKSNANPTGGSFEGFTAETIQLKSNSAGQQVMVAQNADDGEQDPGETLYYAIMGEPWNNPTITEANVKITARAAFSAKNMFVNIQWNNLNGTTTFRLRKNGGDSNLVVSVGSSATGQFEDLVNEDGFIATDDINWEIVTAGSSGWITPSVIGFELEQAAEPYSPAIRSANMGAKMVAAGLI